MRPLFNRTRRESVVRRVVACHCVILLGVWVAVWSPVSVAGVLPQSLAVCEVTQ